MKRTHLFGALAVSTIVLTAACGGVSSSSSGSSGGASAIRVSAVIF